MLFDGASLVLYMCGVTVYIANIVKGLRVVSTGNYGEPTGDDVDKLAKLSSPEEPMEFVGREDSLRVLAASNTILALVMVGVLVLQAGQWYAQRKELKEIEEMDRAEEEKKKQKKKN